MTLFDVIRKALLAGFGLQEAVSRFLKDLVKKGELSETQGAKLLKEWSEKAEKSSDLLSLNVSELITKSLKKMNLATRDDVARLSKEVRSLSKRLSKVEELREGIPKE
jgi:polyhydroxyalkanoate synthesis regulator phasin